MNTRLEAVNTVTALHEVLPKNVPPEQRTSVIRLKFTDTGIADPLTCKDLKESFDFSDPIQKRISEVNMKMMEELREHEGVGIWLSPPGKREGTYYPAGKILVAARSKGDPVLYDVTGQTFSANEFFSFMAGLSKFRRDDYYFIADMPWETLEGIIPIPLVWQGVHNDQLERKHNQEVEEMIPIVKTGRAREVIQEREGVDIREACPSSGGAAYKLVTPDGKIKTFVENCGVCSASIHDWMAPGDKCPHCHEVYLGICG